jgi:hypothetical protein
MDKWECQERYDRWWKGKRCRTQPLAKFKRVSNVELIGPPSFVYGDCILHYEDGTSDSVFHGNSFRPRKFDVEVEQMVAERRRR